jgi:uncharacterized membrane protein
MNRRGAEDAESLVPEEEFMQAESISNMERQMLLVSGGVCLVAASRRRSWVGLALGVLGTGLVYQGVTGRSLVRNVIDARDETAVFSPHATSQATAVAPTGIEIRQSITINTPPAEAYQFWRRLENLPRFMEHLASVRPLDDRRSHWVLKAPAGMTLEWDAQIIEDRPNELIAWETLPDTAVQHTGMVWFAPAPGNRGVEVAVFLKYDPPGGIFGEAFAHLTNAITKQQVKEEIRRFKQIMETGEVATIEGQSSGRK